MKKIFVLLFCLSLVSLTVSGQEMRGQARADSLLKLLQDRVSDSEKVNLLYHLCKEYSSIDIGKAIDYGEEGLGLSRALEWDSKEGDFLLATGLAKVRADDFPTAMEYFDKARGIYERLNDMDGLADVLSNIGGVYAQIRKNEEALKYYKEALPIRVEINDQRGIAVLYANIGIVYGQEKEYKQSHSYFNKALKIFKSEGSRFHEAIMYTSIGYAYEAEQRYDEALVVLKKSYELNEKIGNVFRQGEAASKIAEVYALQKNYKAAAKYAELTVRVLDSTGNLDKLSDGYRVLAKANSKTGNYKKAYLAMEQFIDIKDSAVKRQNAKQIEELLLKADFKQQQLADSIHNANEMKAASAKLSRQRMFTYLGIAIALILVTLLFFIAKERKKSDKLLLNILPEEVTKELKERGATTAQHFDKVTVLFTDFVAFTQAGERMGSQALVGELHACFKVFDEIISKYGIEKIKTIGDAYLAVCGLPLTDDYHAEKVLQAAQEIRDFMVSRHKQLGDKTFEVRIGVHSGEVVAGIVGVKKFAYDIWGDTVNTAARMEQHSEAGKINISQTTYELVKDKFTCTYRGELAAKNKGKLEMYFVEA